VGQDDGELAVAFDAEQIKGGGRPAEGVAVEELYGKQVDADGTLGAVLGLAEVDEEQAEFFVGELVGGPFEVAGEVGDASR